jgi:thioredoxin 1
MAPGGRSIMKPSVHLLLFVLIAVLIGSGAASAQNKPKVTFLEIGSTNCIPCKKMQPIMQSIEKKYGDQIKVIFHDVRKEKDKAELYKVEMIPTQVFLDEKGKEIHRHVGYYPEKEIDKFLKKQGLKAKS